jgi:predicted metal-dependent phosphoesterase TrpH
MIDLHMHTTCSDGVDSPTELLQKVVAADLKFFSVTDHDDLRANREILAELQTRNHDVAFITGMEISGVFENYSLHLLCYNFNPDDKSIEELFIEAARLRKERVATLIAHLKEQHSIILPENDIKEILQLEVPGKPHIADAVYKNELTDKERKDFFANCLDDMDTRKFKLNAKIVIESVHKAGGFVVFAHPIELQREYGVGIRFLRGFIKSLKKVGLDGIEIYHSSHGEVEVARYLKLAKENDLLVTAGSDYHGKRKQVTLGKVTRHRCEVDAKAIIRSLPL